MKQPAKQLSTKLFNVDLYERTACIRPLFGLEKLVKIQRRQWNGVLLCDNVVSVTDVVTFSPANTRRAPFVIAHGASGPSFLGEPRINAVNESSAESMQRFHDHGKTYSFEFTPQRGQTYSIAAEIYRPLETLIGRTRCRFPDDAWFASCVFTLDLTAYLKSGYAMEAPECVHEAAEGKSHRAADGPPRRRLKAAVSGGGVWQWRVKNVRGGFMRITWAIEDPDPSKWFAAANLEGLARELSVDTGVTKDLHNFVRICQYYAAGYRSLHTIAGKMLTNRVVLFRSLDAIERLVGTELAERKRGKGLIRITDAGEAVLEWWSRFYMRWTPIAPDSAAPN